MAGNRVINPSGNPDIDGLLWGYGWDTTTLRYSFPIAATQYTNNGYASVTGFVPLNAAQQASYGRIIDNINSFSALHIVQITDPNVLTELRFAAATSINYGGNDNRNHVPGNNTAEGNPPDPGLDPYIWGDVWFNTAGHYDQPPPGTFAYSAGLMHELGHALGLKHGHVTQDGHGILFPALPFDHDSYEYSVMTYKQFVGDAPDADVAPNHPTTYMQDDIAALQYMYGANYGSNAGNTTYKFDPATGAEFVNGVLAQPAPTVIEHYDHPFSTNYILMTIWDGGGTDTYDFSNYVTGITADLNPGGWINLGTEIADLGNGHFARANIANAQLYQGNPASLIENVIGGSGRDNLIGNIANNALFGGPGDDSLSGGGGDDTLNGGAGADQLDGGAGVNTVSYSGSPAAVRIDLLFNTADGGDAHGDGIRNFLNAVGSSFNDVLIGNDGPNSLLGGDGDDALAGRAGGDLLDGGGGQNTAYYDTSAGAIQINLAAHGGLGGDAQGDVLVNIQSVVGTAFADVLTGDGGANNLYGGGGNDWVRGGAGGDFLDGGAGENTAYYDTSAAAVQANLAINSGVGGDATGDLLFNVQDVVGSAFGDVLTGDGAANKLWGGGGDDWLRGGGGADLLEGGAGVNTAWYDTSGAAVRVDLLFTTGTGGDAQGDVLHGVLNLVGSSFNDVLIGDGGPNSLFGGAGNDALAGRAGGDLLDGGAGENTAYYDTSSNAVQVNLAAHAGLGGDAQGDVLFNIQDVVGSRFADNLTGDGESNQLIGGLGADVLTGGAGRDTFLFRPGEANGDIIADFDGAGADAGDELVFSQYGVGASFTMIDTGHWQVNYHNGADHDVITFANGAGGAIHPSDYFFV